MQTVVVGFQDKTESNVRAIIAKIEIDWNKDETFTDESDYSIVLENESHINEPLGGIQLSLCDVQLSNETDRFTPPPTNPA